MPPIRLLFLSLALAAVAAACDDDDDLVATEPNVVDTFTIAALTGTPVSQPSGFSVADGQPVRTDLGAFDFAFDIQQDGTPVFLPLEAMGLPASGAAPGLQLRPESFDEITVARSNGYVTDQPVPIAVGQVYMARSRIVCTLLGVPLYGKLEILAFGDDRTVTFRALSNLNCGFTGLAPGLPED